MNNEDEDRLLLICLSVVKELKKIPCYHTTPIACSVRPNCLGICRLHRTDFIPNPSARTVTSHTSGIRKAIVRHNILHFRPCSDAVKNSCEIVVFRARFRCKPFCFYCTVETNFTQKLL